MRIHIHHTTRYTYAEPVALQPHTLRMRPREDASQRLESFRLHVEPEGARRSQAVDLEGNTAAHVWFTEPSDHLHITADSVVETHNENPFDFVVRPGMERTPIPYGPAAGTHLAPYLAQPEPHPDVAAYAQRINDRQDRDAVNTLVALTADIHATTNQVERLLGPPLPPEETLTRREATCRDMATLLITCARHVGIAARFVSGYTLGQGANDGNELHAWAEAYLPGAGWRAFDPTTGLAVADHHVAVAAAADPADASPVTGTYYGRARARLDTQVKVRPAERP